MKNKWLKRYFVDALSGMALGLFSTLIIGLIIKQIGSFFPVLDSSITEPKTYLVVLRAIGQFCIKIGQILTVLTGAGIAIGVANALGVPKLVLYASILTGTVGAYATGFISAFAIANNILSGKEGYIKKYKAFLSAGSSINPIELLKMVDVDITKKSTLNEVFKLYRDLIKEFKNLTKEK